MNDAIASFWKWFRTGPGKWKKPDDSFDEQRWLEVADALAERIPGLSPQYSYTPWEGYELTFSLIFNRDPEARARLAPLVRQLVRAAPKLPLWKFHAFAPKICWGDAFLPGLDLPGDQTLKVAQMKFEVKSAKPLTLKVYVPRFTPRRAAAFQIGVERVLEAGMGEGWVLEKLRRLELESAARAPKRAKPLAALSR